jgi:hypothetical protein
MPKNETGPVVQFQERLCTHGQAQRLRIRLSPFMSNVFMAGPDLVRWELTSCGDQGPYRLIVRHAHGSIVEYFESPTAALIREAELEDLLVAARGGRPLAHGAIV